MVKISDVAREAGVSTATVSRALNNNPTVAPELVERVTGAAERLGYRPNTVARSLRQRKTSLWVLIISDIENPFFTAVARGVEDVAQENGYSLVLCNADEDADKEQLYLSIAEQEQAAGVILSPHSASSRVSRLTAAGIPLVTVDRELDENADTVLVDSATGAKRATHHLLDAGWRRPACITGPADAMTAVDRRRGYEAALAERGLAGNAMVAHEEFRGEAGRRAVSRLLDAADPPDSFFIANSTLALGALAEISRRGQRIGEDLGLIAFDDAPWAPFIDPPMSVVSQPAYEIGVEAARILVRRIKEGASSVRHKVVLDTSLIARESSQRVVVVPADWPAASG